MARAMIKNLDIGCFLLLLLALGTLREPGLLSGYFLDQSGHLDALRNETCSSLMHRRQKLAAVIVNCRDLFHVDFDLFGG
jgi:hypothetical protein